MRQYDYTDELYHYGVKGMKWRYRKARAQTTQDGAGGPHKKPKTTQNYVDKNGVNSNAETRKRRVNNGRKKAKKILESNSKPSALGIAIQGGIRWIQNAMMINAIETTFKFKK